jgi:outer membrane protein TolC
VFEGLTQAERNVVYAARNFARFRKQLFRDLAFQYYSLVLTYRGIEIDSQDYFSNLRAFEQGDAEYRAGRLPRFQVDQFEQRALASRSGLIGACNSLERSLDNLKLRIGLPPEMPVNLDLTELEMLTLRDETTVSGELVRRARRNLASERHATSPDRSVLLNASIDLTRRMLDLADLRERLGEEAGEIDALEVLLARLSADEARMLVEFNRDVLEQEKRAELAAPPIRIFQRTMDSVDSLLILVTHQLDLAARLALDQAAIEQIAQRARQVTERYEQVRRELEKTVGERELDRIPELIEAAQRVLDEAASLAGEADVLVGAQPLDAEQDLQRTLEQIDWLLAQSEHMAVEQSVGLVPIEIEMDDAMLTALVQRFDLMNQRGALADTWRQIKLTGDDLRSVLNLNASQAIRTRSDVNRPFDFTFDDSQTRLSLQFDTPLNRKSQRNSFRTSLVNYNVALRNLMELEDQIKLNVRDDLRQLQLDREQYQIAVASAALAHERVVSTRLQLRLGINNVSARDFLEAQQAYTASLSSVASQHIGYLRDRIQLFIDLELLEVDDNGFWPDLYDEQHQPEPDARWPSYVCPYGELPGGVLYSGKVKRMLSIPAGRASAGRRQAEPPPGGFPDLETIDPFLPEEP